MKKFNITALLGKIKTVVKYAGLVMVAYDTIVYFSNRLEEYKQKSEDNEKLSK